MLYLLSAIVACEGPKNDPSEPTADPPHSTTEPPTTPDSGSDCEAGRVDATALSAREMPRNPLGRTLVVDLDGAAGAVVSCVLDAEPPRWHEPLPYASVWRWFAPPADADDAFHAVGFDDGDWSEGVAPFAFEDEGTTIIEPVSDQTWFRTTFTIEGVERVQQLRAAIRRDDGAVVYLNGVEVGRDNVPPVVRQSGDDERSLFPLTIDPAALVEGVNVVAVSLHQRADSTDGGFGLRLATLVDGPVEPEEHVLVASESARRHEVPLYGLLAESTYTCEARSTVCEGATARSTFTTEALSTDVPALASPPGQGTPVFGSWTLINHQRPCADERTNRLFILDPEGRVRWYRELPLQGGSTIDVESVLLPDQTILWGGGEQPTGTPQILALDGSVVYESTYPGVENDVYHHDLEPRPDGRIVGIVQALVDDGGDQFSGFGLVEHDPATGLETWRWDTQEAFDRGELSPRYPGDPDPWHVNSLALVDDAEGSGVYASLLYSNEIIRIDRATGHVSWRLGRGQDFQLLDPAGSPSGDEEWFDHLHAIDVVGDRLILYENGWGPSRSRAVVLRLDVAARTATLDWTYEEPGWYEPNWGDADLTPGGSVVIAMAHAWCLGASPDHLGSLVEVVEATHEVPWRLDFLGADDSGYRAQRIASCDLFANTRYCPELLDAVPQRP